MTVDQHDGFDVFVYYRDVPPRRKALGAPSGSPERYMLFGLDQLVERGLSVHHNLERPGPPPRWARAGGAACNWFVARAGGYGGDFAGALASVRRANRAGVVFSTVDTVGIPLLLLRRVGVIRPALVYVSIGLPERLAKLRGRRIADQYADALRRCAAVVTYSEYEAALLRRLVGEREDAPPVVFVPFGVDPRHFSPVPEAAPTVDVVSIGADPYRDFALLVGVAARHPERRFRIVASAEGARGLGRLPANVELETEIALAEMSERIARARVVALPVQPNSYSGATTVLLQAMAMAKPVVVSRTPAIATGYGLADGANCRLVEPGDESQLEGAILELLDDGARALELGRRARETVERELSWERYAETIHRVLVDAYSRNSHR